MHSHAMMAYLGLKLNILTSNYKEKTYIKVPQKAANPTGVV